jgi:zinc and cadmium transporter
MVYFYTLASVSLISLVSFVGVFTLSLRKEKLNKITLYLVSLSAGTLLGGAFLHLLPEIIEEKGAFEWVWLSLLAGLVVFFVLEKIICWRHCHVPTSREHPHPLGIMNLVGDGLHNFLDGVVIAGAYMLDPVVGLATTVAVVAHEIPQEIADFGVLVHAGYTRVRALALNFLIALSAVAGALITLVLGEVITELSDYIIPFTAGGFIYIATADLIPELKKEPHPKKSLGQLAVILAGIGLMYYLKVLFE